MKKTPALSDVSTSFIAQHDREITAVLHCWDRLQFMGSVGLLQRPQGLMMLLYQLRVLLKDFKEWALAFTQRVCDHALTLAQGIGQERVEFVRDSALRKDQQARARWEARGRPEGLIGVWSAVEPCTTYFVRKDASRQHLRLERGFGKGLHLFFYFFHAQCGLLHLRLQTWFPFNLTCCLNGHEWLARQMDLNGLGYTRRENAFSQLAEPAAAPALADAQHQMDWTALRESLRTRCHPLAAELCTPVAQNYYWTLHESEFSTDLLFRRPADLAALYPQLLHYGLKYFGCREVLRFLGRRGPAEGLPKNFEGELDSTLRTRPEGARRKHFADGNSVKMYDKQGRILRVETTIGRPRGFRVLRESKTSATQRWQPMRKAVADGARRAQVSRAVNERYLQACAAIPLAACTGQVVERICRRRQRAGRRYRALRPWSAEDGTLLTLLNLGEWTLQGLNNAELRLRLYPGAHTPAETKRLSARVSRWLRLLRVHGLIKKIGRSHRYLLTKHGRQIICALQTARLTSVEKLVALAA